MANETDAPAGRQERKPITLLDAAAEMLGVDRISVQENEQVLVPFSDRNVVAVVPADEARDVVVRIERTGTDGDRISLLRLDDASLSGSGAATPRPRLEDPMVPQERAIVKGAVICAVAGAAIAGLLLWAISDATAALWAAVGGAALGGALGGLWGAFSRIGASDAWERSLHTDTSSIAVVGVHVDGAEDAASMRDTLSGREVWVFDRAGTVVERPPAR